MRFVARLALFVELAALAVGCSTPLAELRRDLDGRAATELQCPADKLTYKELDRLISTTKLRVSGCDRTVEYQMVESQWRLTKEAAAK